MDTSLLPALVGFAFASSITPGPNNMMLLASGANFGLRRSLPHMLGISLGHALMVVLVGLGLIGLFEALPWLDTVLTWIGVGYLLFLAWKIATTVPSDGTARGRPFTFLQAAAFQWVNPKAWFMALTAVTVYLAEQSVAGVGVVALIFAAVNFPSITLWTGLGQALRRVLSDPRRLRLFNWTMAGLLVLSAVPVLLG